MEQDPNAVSAILRTIRHPDVVRTDDIDSTEIIFSTLDPTKPHRIIRTIDSAGFRAEHDSRLEEYLEMLKSRRLSEFIVSTDGLTLALLGDDSTSLTRDILIEHPTIRITRGNEVSTHDRNDLAVLEVLMTCLDETLADITVTEAVLTVSFPNGVVFTVDGDDDDGTYMELESWHIASDTGLHAACFGDHFKISYPPKPLLSQDLG